jgi:hypothetical protein
MGVHGMKRLLGLFLSCSLSTGFTRICLGAMLVLMGFGVAAHAQNSCLAECKSPDSPCTGLQAAQRAQCVAQCQKQCQPVTPPPPLLDPRCGDRTATGKFSCTINQPVVNQHEHEYPAVQFAPGDTVDVQADGCVQTGGTGDTWKRYVNPTGGGTNDKYHGLIRIPTANPAGGGLIRIQTVIGKHQTITGTGVPISQLVLHLGYEDDDYSDNGYYRHDDGNDDQCKMGGSSDGGPAHVTITICRGVPCGTPVSRFDFDVLSSFPSDPNGLPYNPQWSWQQRPENHGQIPNTSLCHEFSERPTILGIPQATVIPNFPDCTDQADLNSVDAPDGINGSLCGWRKGGPFMSGSFVGHLNWFPVTVEGEAGWGDHGLDDDYTFTFTSSEPGNPLSVNGRNDLHVEFDSEETIDNFTTREWKDFHDAVDGNGTDPTKLFDGHTILTGMFGLDGEHDWKAELHPLYAIATRQDKIKQAPGNEVWLMFVRNRGDEGFCSSQLWDAGFEDYTFRLPWLPGMTSVDVNWNKSHFEGPDGTSGPMIAAVPPAPPPLTEKTAGVYVTFHLGPAASSPFIDGVLHLVWTGQPPSTMGSAAAAGTLARRAQTPGFSDTLVATVGSQSGVEIDEIEHRIRAAVNQLPPAQRLEVQKARASIAGGRPGLHRLPPGGPVRILTAPPAIARISRVHAIKAGPASRKAARDAAQIHALCIATHGAPPGLPPEMCKGTVRDHR